MKVQCYFLCLLLSAFACGIVSVHANEAPYVVLDSGRRIDGVSVSADEDGRILLHTTTGLLTFDKGTRVFTPRPRELDQALQHMQQRQFAKAVQLLQQVATANRNLGWDKEALKLLARAYVGNGKAVDAARTYELLFDIDLQARNDAEDFLRYLRALDTSGQHAKLEGLLDEVIRTAPRAAAAWAQLRRGNMARDRGELWPALLDFKRTADFFADQKETHPEALFLTADVLKRLGDERAADYGRRLKEAYPASPFVHRLPGQ